MLQILLLLHCFWCICPHVSVMNSGDLPTLIHPECALQRREHDRVKASVLLHCWGAETLRRLCSVFSVWYPPNPPVSPAASALQPPSPGLQLRWRPWLLLAIQARTWLFISAALAALWNPLLRDTCLAQPFTLCLLIEDCSNAPCKNATSFNS